MQEHSAAQEVLVAAVAQELTRLRGWETAVLRARDLRSLAATQLPPRLRAAALGVQPRHVAAGAVAPTDPGTGGHEDAMHGAHACPGTAGLEAGTQPPRGAPLATPAAAAEGSAACRHARSPRAARAASRGYWGHGRAHVSVGIRAARHTSPVPPRSVRRCCGCWSAGRA
jgi:hypothetical protein